MIGWPPSKTLGVTVASNPVSWGNVPENDWNPGLDRLANVGNENFFNLRAEKKSANIESKSRLYKSFMLCCYLKLSDFCLYIVFCWEFFPKLVFTVKRG